MIDNISFLDPRVKVTTDHKEIKQWAEEHNGLPTVFDDPEAGGDRKGIRFDFVGNTDEKYMPESAVERLTPWDKFFDLFDKKELAFMYRPEDEPEDITMAYKFIPKKSVNL